MGLFSDNELIDFAIFYELFSGSDRGSSSGGNRRGWGCGLIVLLCVVVVLVVGKCGNDEANNDAMSVGDAPSYHPVERVLSSTVPVDTLSYSRDIVYTPAPRFSAKTVQEAYDEGYDHGYDDGEEDGMNNDEDASYDDENPYTGRMKESYIAGYQEGYEEGKEEGLDVYNEERDPGEEEEDW